MKKNKTNYKKSYEELNCRFYSLVQRYIYIRQTLDVIRDLINDLERTEKYDEVYRLMSKYIIKDIKDEVLNTISYEETYYNEKRQTDNEVENG